MAVVSLIATETTGAGYVQVLPCGSAPGAYSNLNADHAGQTVANLAYIQFDANGSACVYDEVSTHLVVDLQTYLAPSTVDPLQNQRLIDTRDSPGLTPCMGCQNTAHFSVSASCHIGKASGGFLSGGTAQIFTISVQTFSPLNPSLLEININPKDTTGYFSSIASSSLRPPNIVKVNGSYSIQLQYLYAGSATTFVGGLAVSILSDGMAPMNVGFDISIPCP